MTNAFLCFAFQALTELRAAPDVSECHRAARLTPSFEKMRRGCVPTVRQMMFSTDEIVYEEG